MHREIDKLARLVTNGLLLVYLHTYLMIFTKHVHGIVGRTAPVLKQLNQLEPRTRLDRVHVSGTVFTQAR